MNGGFQGDNRNPCRMEVSDGQMQYEIKHAEGCNQTNSDRSTGFHFRNITASHFIESGSLLQPDYNVPTATANGKKHEA